MGGSYLDFGDCYHINGACELVLLLVNWSDLGEEDVGEDGEYNELPSPWKGQRRKMIKRKTKGRVQKKKISGIFH